MDAPLSRQLGKTLWYGYSPDLSDAEVTERFAARFGHAPKEVIRGASVVLAGPVLAYDDPLDAPLNDPDLRQVDG